MAAALIGIQVLVTLKDPASTVVQGLVANVVAETSTLILEHVFFPASGYRLPSYQVAGAQIADINVQQQPPTPAAPTYPSQYAQPQPPVEQPIPAPSTQPSRTASVATLTPTKPKQSFVDPAILSFTKKPVEAPVTAQHTPLLPQEAPATPVKAKAMAAAAAAAALPTNTSPFSGRAESTATLTAPFSGLGIADSGEVLEDTDDPAMLYEAIRRASVTKTRTGKPMETPLRLGDSAKKPRRQRGNKKQKSGMLFPPADDNPVETSPEVSRKTPANGTYRGKGWRQTPILQDQPTNSPRETPASARKTRKQKAMEATNGWATEDATDVQELPEFDFAANLSKFDKRSVFDQIRNEDTTADEDRLVHFNRIPAPRAGTAGGKNLHPTENVLDGRKPPIRSVSHSESESEFSDFDSGRNSRRNMSRNSSKRPTVRTNSGLQEEMVPIASSGSAAILTRRSFGTRPPASNVAYSSTASPVPARPTPPSSPSISLLPTRHASLRVVSTNTTCSTITPGSMTAVEELAEVEYGLSEDMMAESAARGIGEVALSAINPGGRRLARENLALNARPVVVVLAGNHRTGARAIAAARHLHARGPRVVVALLGYERHADWDKDVRRQLELLKRFGGYVRSWTDVLKGLKRLEAPPELIIDALLGRSKEFDALGREDKHTALQIVSWANSSRASVLAIEGPSGVGGSTGEVSILEGEPLEVRAKYIVCLGAPRTGLFRALRNGWGRDPEWIIWVVDLGLNRPWKKTGMPGGKGIRFGSEWLVQVRYDE
ncbi:YjeF N-terminal domain-like protein, partial [Saccharata proteae CBS 121410]